ncbi:MAG: hypothetical protein LAT57_00370 [Balneolales bacterium]|nr:hypothetical protein [Balneolales bacterium]
MKSFVYRILLVDLILLLAGVLPVYLTLGRDDAVSALIALALTTSYTLLGSYYANTYFDADFNKFMSKVFGAIFIRLVVLAVSIFLILKFSNLPQITFTVSIFISYLSKSVLEILFINRKSANTQNLG